MAQGHFYKDGMCQIVIGNISLSLPHMHLFAEMFCHKCNNPDLEKKRKKATLHSPSIMLKNWLVQGGI